MKCDVQVLTAHYRVDNQVMNHYRGVDIDRVMESDIRQNLAEKLIESGCYKREEVTNELYKEIIYRVFVIPYGQQPPEVKEFLACKTQLLEAEVEIRRLRKLLDYFTEYKKPPYFFD